MICEEPKDDESRGRFFPGEGAVFWESSSNSIGHSLVPETAEDLGGVGIPRTISGGDGGGATAGSVGTSCEHGIVTPSRSSLASRVGGGTEAREVEACEVEACDVDGRYVETDT